jgi:hypothetical protein
LQYIGIKIIALAGFGANLRKASKKISTHSDSSIGIEALPMQIMEEVDNSHVLVEETTLWHWKRYEKWLGDSGQKFYTALCLD